MPNSSMALTAAAPEVFIASSSPSGTGVVTFLSIPQIYSHLHVIMMGRGTQAAVTETAMVMTCNNDTTAGHYAYQFMGGVASVAVAGESTSDTSISIGAVTAATAPANAAATCEIWIYNYKSTTFDKPVSSITGRRTATGSAGMVVAYFAGFFVSTAAVSRLDFTLASGNYVAGTLFSLYGAP